MPMGQNVPPITGNDAPPTVQVAQPAQPLAYHSLSMADRAVPMVTRQALVMHNDVPADYQAAILAQSTQFAGSHSHLSVPQGVAQPQVQPQLAYPQLAGAPPQPHALAAQLYALPPLPAGHGHAQQNTQAPGCLYVPQHMQGCEGANRMYGPQYGHTPQVQDGTYPLPYVPSAQAHGGQAAVHQHLQPQMGPAPPPPAPAPFAPHGASQAAPQVDPCGVTSGVAVCPEGAPPAAPPGIGMDIDVGGGEEPADNPAPEGGFPNLSPAEAAVIKNYPIDMQPVVSTYAEIGRIIFTAGGTYLDVESSDPQDETMSCENAGRWCWDVSNKKHKTNYPFQVMYLRPIDVALCTARNLHKNLLIPHTRHFFDLRHGEPEHNIDMKNRMLPHGIHEGIPEEGRKPFESDYLLDAVRMTAFNTKRSMAYICTLCHHIVYLHREGEFDNRHLNAIQQGGTFKLYLDKLAKMKKRKPGDLWNLRMQIWNYCMEFHVEPDPRPAVTPPSREWSPDATELVGTQFLSHLP
ncbi:hypothetical protein FRC11_001248, partial [Ceratobasidium sp. 423]